MKEMYDIAILGAGPAGAMLASLLPRYLKIVVLDKSGDADGFRKPCGGLLAPDAQRVLSKLGLTLPKSVLVDPQVFSVRTIDVKSRTVRHYPRFYINMDRFRFDNWLRSLIPDSVTRHTETKCTAIVRENGGFTLSASKNGDPLTLRAKLLVGADGANSMVRRSFFKHRKLRTYTAIQQWFTDMHPQPYYSCVFDESVTDCYAWGLSKDGRFILGGAFPPTHARRAFEALKTKLTAFGIAFDAPQKTEACTVLRPRLNERFVLGENGIFLIGEAAGFISPSSLEGLSYALESAYALSRALTNPQTAHRCYRKATRRMRRNLRLKQLKCGIIFRPFLRRLAMKSGISSIGTLVEFK